MAAFKIGQAKRHGIRARVLLTGPSGSGKTLTALKIGRGIVGASGRICVIDTENGSASLYSGEDGVGSFDTGTMEGDFSPEAYIAAIRAVEGAGHDLVIIDSASHEWMGPGGCLDLVDTASQRMRGNSYAAWKDVTPRHNAFLHAMLHSKCHVIATMRSKQEYAQAEENGRKTVQKLGMAPITRDGAEYEFAVVGDMDLSHALVFSKTRCRALDGKTFRHPGADVAAILTRWLSEGGEPDPAPAPKPDAATPAPAADEPAPSESTTPGDGEFIMGVVADLHAAASSADIDAALLRHSAEVVRRWPDKDAPQRTLIRSAAKKRAAELATNGAA